jgi:hypothetical protein
MASPADYFPRDARRRRTVRLLFLAVAIYFAAGVLLRKRVGEIYPGLLMPSFAGIGLEAMTARDGEIVLPHIVVTFSDQTAKEITLTQLSNGSFFPSVLASKFFLHDSDGNDRPLGPDAVAYLERRARQLFPDKTPAKVTITLDRERFPLDRPKERTVIARVAEREIVFP